MLKNAFLILLNDCCVIPKKDAIYPKLARWKRVGYSCTKCSYRSLADQFNLRI